VAARSNNTPLIAIVGETGSGKTSLGLLLAQQCSGEIIAADSRTVYKGLDIGTAKPNHDEQKLVRHHLIDVVNPETKFSAAEFKRQAYIAIESIAGRDNIPFLVGGTGLYVDAVLYDFTFRSPPNPAQRVYLESLTIDELQRLINDQGLPMPENKQNPRHLIRTIETKGARPQRQPLRPNTLVIGIKTDGHDLRTKIEHRVDAMLASGLEQEVRRASLVYGWDAPGMQSPGYKEWKEYFEGTASLEEVRAKCIQGHLMLAKRQRTWFRRNKNIHWTCKTEEAVDLVTTFLNK